MGDENNVDNKMVKLKLTIAPGKCLNCGYERILYFTSDYTYGERIVSTQSGMFCAYANLLGDNICNGFRLRRLGEDERLY